MPFSIITFAKKRSWLLFSAVMLAAGTLNAQPLNSENGPRANRENSPYSRYGIGDISNSQSAVLRGMGGGATGYIDPFSVNSFNPASYGFLKVTVLDFALEGRQRTVSIGDQSTTSGTGTLSYLAMGIPLGKYAGMAFGFKPISTTYYNANDSSEIAGIGKTINNYNGTGGLQYVYFGASGKYKGFSVGFNAGYVFGNFAYSRAMQVIEPDSTGTNSGVRDAQFTRSDYVSGLYWKGGLMYHARFEKERYLNIGAAVTLSQTLNVKRSSYDIGYHYQQGGLVADTTHTESGKKGDLEMPAEYAFGIVFGKTFHWSIAGDFVYTDWSQYAKMGARDFIVDNAWRFSLGGEITPDPEATSKKYFSLVTYRLGGYYGRDYVSINGKELNYFGGTIGASFPLKRNRDNFARIHTALDLGQRGTLDDGLAREFFVKFTVGVSFNDIWFIKRKFN